MGKYITLAPPITIWWRCVIGFIFLGLYCKWSNINLNVDLSKYGKSFFISSLLLVGHWVTYFYSLHLSNVAIAFITLYTYPTMTTILEPLMFKQKFKKLHLIMGVLVLVGIYIMTPPLDFSDGHFLGILVGLVSALCFALRNLFSKDLAQHHNGSHLILVQLGIGILLLFPLLFFFENNNAFAQWEAILFLGVVTTAAGHTLFIRSFNHFSVSTSSLLASIIPIYGILLAFFFLNEIPNTKTIIGGAIILLTVFVESFRVSKKG